MFVEIVKHIAQHLILHFGTHAVTHVMYHGLPVPESFRPPDPNLYRGRIPYFTPPGVSFIIDGNGVARDCRKGWY